MKSRVAIVPCADYSPDNVASAIERLLELLPDWDLPLQPAERLLLKPNLLMRRLPEEATTTHPEVIRQLALVLAKSGKTSILADSPGGPFSEAALKRVYEGCGLTELSDEGLLTLNYDTRHTEIETPAGHILKRMVVGEFVCQGLPLVNLCKLKTHVMMTYTGAVKNLFGIVPGTLKAEYHFRMPKEDDFADALIDICMAGNPQFCVMDAIVSMEGAGPSAGSLRQTGLLLASADPFALDLVTTHLIGLRPQEVPTVRRAIHRGLSPASVEEVDVVGMSIDEASIENFAIPKTRGPSFLQGKAKSIADAALRPLPVFDYKLCTGCGICARHCPAKVITMQGGKPKVKLVACIRCFCCHELCPSKAVSIRRKPLMRMISKM